MLIRSEGIGPELFGEKLLNSGGDCRAANGFRTASGYETGPLAMTVLPATRDVPGTHEPGDGCRSTFPDSDPSARDWKSLAGTERPPDAGADSLAPEAAASSSIRPEDAHASEGFPIPRVRA